MVKNRIPRTVLVNLGLAAGGVAFALVMIQLGLMLFPQLRSGSTLVKFTLGVGDIFYNQPGWVAPPDEPYQVLAEFPLVYDEDGFRMPARPAEHYQVLALGDSYTEAANVSLPWPDTLARASGLSVRNLGFRGYGPVEEALVLQQYGPDSDPDYVIVGFFEGNDLSNAVTARDRNLLMPIDSTMPDEEFADLDIWMSDHEGPFRYPMRLQINDQEIDIAFLEGYVWGLNGDLQVYAQSLDLEITAQSWHEMDAVLPDDCLIIAFFPSKPHIYLPYLMPEYQDVLLENVAGLDSEPGGRIQLVQEDTPFDVLVDRLDNLRDAVAARARAEGFIFFDLTPFFQEAAARGELLHYAYDTHWNQAGHDLAGRVLADFVASDPCGSQN